MIITLDKKSICLIVLLVLSSAVAFVQNENVRPNGNGKYHVPQFPTNTRYGVTYPCVLADGNRWPGTQWMTGLRDENDPDIIHHMVLYTIPEGSPLLQAGGAFFGAKDGDVIDDCTSINSAPSHPTNTMYADQPGNDNLALVSGLDENAATANGYTFGVPFGKAQTKVAFYAFQFHVHNDDMLDNITVPISWKVKTTTDVPNFEGGMIFAGVSTPVPGFPDDAFMNIPVNADGEYTMQAITQPAALSCETSPEAVSCESCCPIVPPVRLDNAAYEGRMQRIGLQNVSIFTSFIHSHGRQLRLNASKIAFDGTRTFIDECIGCGHHTGVNAFHILPEPVVLKAGEGFEVNGVWGQSHDPHHHGHNMNVIGGYRSDQEMLLFFGYYGAPVGQSLAPARTLTYGGQCDNVQNKGYPNESRALARYPWLDAYFCRGNCPFDPTC